ncbi:MAG: phasin family protein [Pseudomonadota bacterium]
MIFGYHQFASSALPTLAAKPVFNGVDQAVRAGQPTARSVMRAHIEAGGFVTKRMKANMDLPAQMAQCRDPNDLMALTASYWLQAFEDYATTGQRMAQCFGFPAESSVPTIEDWSSVEQILPRAPATVERAADAARTARPDVARPNEVAARAA